MGGIIRFLSTPLTTVQGTPLTLIDLAITVGSVLIFYILARVAARQFQKKLENRLKLTATNRRLTRTVIFLSILFAGVYTSLSYLGINLSIFLVPLRCTEYRIGSGTSESGQQLHCGTGLDDGRNDPGRRHDRG